MPTSSQILDRIIALKEIKNDAGLARFLNVKPAIISNWRTRNTIPYETVFSFCEHNGLTLDYVITGRGPKYTVHEDIVPDAGVSGVREKKGAYTSENEEFVYISQVIGRISAGNGRIPENDVDVRIAFRKEWIRRKGDPKKMALIKVDGDSMEPSLVSGDLVLIDRNRNYIDPQGGIYALALDDIIMIKRVQALSGNVRIISDNPKYPPFDAPSGKILVNGKVIWFAREIER